MSIRTSWCALVILTVAGAACHTKPPATTATRPLPPKPAAAPPAATVRQPPQQSLTEAELFQRKSLTELNAEHPLRDAFFNYNQNTLRDDAKRALQQDAQWLTKWPQTKIRVDGHCDERGSAEYNLALGVRRSATVRTYLTSLGVKPDRMETRSVGKNAPFCRDTGESCWSQNRRIHFEITAK